MHLASERVCASGIGVCGCVRARMWVCARACGCVHAHVRLSVCVSEMVL